MKTILILSLVLLSVSCQSNVNGNDQPPVWPERFEQTFNETFSYPLLGSSSTTGKFFYDWKNRRYRIDRANGKWDRYCGPVYPLSNTPCSHIVVDGKRYLYYPEKNYCCYCCDSSHGCGILRPDWLSSAAYLGTVQENGVEYQKWDMQGLQHNYFFSTNDGRRVMRRIVQEPNDVQEFDVESFVGDISDEAVLTLPSQCNPNKTCPFATFCSALRLGQ
jgi:hypothetical protein